MALDLSVVVPQPRLDTIEGLAVGVSEGLLVGAGVGPGEGRPVGATPLHGQTRTQCKPPSPKSSGTAPQAPHGLTQYLF